MKLTVVDLDAYEAEKKLLDLGFEKVEVNPSLVFNAVSKKAYAVRSFHTVLCKDGVYVSIGLPGERCLEIDGSVSSIKEVLSLLGFSGDSFDKLIMLIYPPQ